MVGSSGATAVARTESRDGLWPLLARLMQLSHTNQRGHEVGVKRQRVGQLALGLREQALLQADQPKLAGDIGVARIERARLRQRDLRGQEIARHVATTPPQA